MILDEVKRLAKPADIILDIGCGIRPQKYIRSRIHICADPHQKYLDCLGWDKSLLKVRADWKQAIELFPAVDTVFLLDVIEHLEKAEAIDLLEATKQIARSQIVILTPLGFCEQGPDENGRDAWGLDGGELQRHRSGWLPDDFAGPDWKILTDPNFSPRCGALLAIWTNPGHKDQSPLPLTKRQRLHYGVDIFCNKYEMMRSRL